ncbi:MAG: hypothetical protein FWD23_12695 [Oscillospiraceae bacterium]|nr:hypothetical protein [Oscillospiraceae bacterium]
MEQRLNFSNIPEVHVDKDPALTSFLSGMRRVVQKDRSFVQYKNRLICTNPSWVRDHIHEMKAYKHWESDLTSFIDTLLELQTEDGFFYEILTSKNDGHTTFVNDDCLLFEGDAAYIRLEMEADVEYLMVEGAYTAYQATGNTEWIKKALPKLERAMEYMLSDEKRFDQKHGLVKRAFSIDTWDFTYGYPDTNRRIEADMPMSIMHGDNSGMIDAMRRLSALRLETGDQKKAAYWENKAREMLDNLIKVCWNGNYFTHQVHLNHPGAEGCDESKILSLSNAYDINRNVTTQKMTDSIIEEYKKRRDSGVAFAEWFSIDPPYPVFFRYEAGQYINGAITSFTAGELMRAALKNGHESYGYDILCRIRQLYERDNDIYFMYSRDDASNLGGGPSGWGSAAILAAFEEGIAGIEDKGFLFGKLAFSPRWALTGAKSAEYLTGYAAGSRYVRTCYELFGDKIVISLTSPSETVDCHIMLPKGAALKRALVGGAEVSSAESKTNEASYADFSFRNTPGDNTGTGSWICGVTNDIVVELK